MRQMFAPTLLVSLLVAPAQAGEAPVTGPVVGEKAPRLALGPTFKGGRLDAFTPGKVYVIEFWATWCKPCLDQLPHTRELQKAYPGVEFVWVDVWEGDEAGVARFVDRMGDQMPGTVTMDTERDADGIGLTARTWLPATGIKGIPATVIIGADGRVAWMGTPERMDAPLQAIVEGRWDLAGAVQASRLRRDLAKTLEEYEVRLRTAVNDGPAATEAILRDYLRVLESHRQAFAGALPTRP